MNAVVATFGSRDALLHAIDAARQERVWIITAVMPAYDADVVAALGIHRATGSIATVAGAIAAAITLLCLKWMVDAWPNVIVGGKPLFSWPAFLIVTFEMTILGAAIAAVVAAAVHVVRARSLTRGLDLPLGETAFVLLLSCAPGNIDAAFATMWRHGAVQCRLS